jgi:ATP-dependent helicase IRC3
MTTALFSTSVCARRQSTTAAAPPPDVSPPNASTPSDPSSAPLQLREYQKECIQTVLDAIAAGHKRMGISLATGSGKTVIFTHLIPQVPPPTPAATRTLVLAHRRELVEQAARHCARAHPDALVEIEMGAMHASGAADITVASVQSITSRERLEKYDPARFKLVLVDEAHHIVSPNYMRVLEHFGLSTKQPDSPTLVGVSATFGRFDGLALGAAIDEIVFHKDYVDMIGEKWLADVVFTTVESSVDLSRVKNSSSGDFNQTDLSRAVNTAQTNEITVQTWLAKANAAGRKSTLIFCVDVAHVLGLTNLFRHHGIDARFVTGETPKLERAATLDGFRAAEFPVLVNCGVFTEGTDIPNIDCVVLARPTRSRNLLVQMIGRGMRLHPLKTNCHIIDMVSSLETGIVTTPTLFGLNPNELVDEASVDDMRLTAEQRRERAERMGASESDAARQRQLRLAEDPATAAASLDPAALSRASVTFTEYASVFDLISDTSGERHIRAVSPFAWVNVAPDRYILANSDGSYVRLERGNAGDVVAGDEDGAPPVSDESSLEELLRSMKTTTSSAGPAPWVAWHVKAIPFYVRNKGASNSSAPPFSAPRQILRATTFSDAIHGADRFASGAFPRFMIARDAPWRNRPATQGQLDFLNKVRSRTGDPPLTADTLAKGLAMDMITKLRHGARGRFAQHKASKKRVERAGARAEKASQRKKNEEVRVGPLAAA